MEVPVIIAFQQLVQLAKRLPVSEWEKLKQEVAMDTPKSKDRDERKKLLLNGPTFSTKQLDVTAETKKSTNKWRTK